MTTPAGSAAELAALYRCNGCGACCRPLEQPLDRYARIWPEDDGLLVLHPEIAVEVRTDADGHERQLATKRGPDGCVCVFLVGVIGRDAHCSIYDHRPVGCRGTVMHVGDAACRGLRCVAGLPAGPNGPAPEPLLRMAARVRATAWKKAAVLARTVPHEELPDRLEALARVDEAAAGG